MNLVILLLMQVPPTPSPFPTPDPSMQLLDMPSLTLWQYSDEAIQGWRLGLQTAQIFQAIVVVLIIIVGLNLLIKFMKRMSNDGEGE